MENQIPNESSVISALKLQWRYRLKTIRQEINHIRRKEASALACTTLQTLSQHTLFILSFASFGSEIDLWPFNKALANEGRLVLPRVESMQLHLYQVYDLKHLKANSWGLLEPTPSFCNLINLSEIDLALIPGLGFDLKTRTRLGYGKGYYDRLLSKNKSAQTCGIGFQEQALDDLPHDKHDIHLNKIYLF